ncbi:MAG TPA: ABC transporter permease subunit [Verrucomicrobiae bacterium]|jgi:ABC-type transport system involved in multi-copper enzyme maturation permease subunit|nr:ABC transporter permease subunit [Verrucomicrobiae bacterium]
MKNIFALSTVVLKESVRRKDFYVLFVVTAVITLMMGSVNFFHDSQIDRYLKEICLLLIWISSLVITITMAARQIPAEKESRTIYPLLAKPISRTEVLLGKFLGCWLATAITLIVFYAFFGLMAMSKEHHWPVANYFQAIWLHWTMLGVIIAMTVLGSLVFSAVSANVTISFMAVTFILLVGRHLDQVAVRLGEPAHSLLMGLFYAIPHLEFFDVRDLVIHNWPSIHWSVCVKATAYGAVYGAFFLLAACLCFRRRALN